MSFEEDKTLREVEGRIVPVLANAAEHEVLDGGHCDVR